MKKTISILTGCIILICSLILSVKYYSFIFAKTVKGEVLRIERVNTAEAIIATKEVPAAQLFSFAISIRDSKGEIHTSSTEDRQWAVVSPGQCAEARFFPYPPWELSKARTYFGARLERLFDCTKAQTEK